jgi:hypothetical protein
MGIRALCFVVAALVFLNHRADGDSRPGAIVIPYFAGVVFADGDLARIFSPHVNGALSVSAPSPGGEEQLVKVPLWQH